MLKQNKREPYIFHFTTNKETTLFVSFIKENFEHSDHLKYYFFPDYNDAVRLGIAIEENNRFDAFVEVKGDVPFFGDSSKDLTFEEFYDEMKTLGLHFDLEGLKK
jgi:hypothetical protein